MTFKEFWLRYLKAHSKPATRCFHYIASSVGALSALTAYLQSQIWIFLCGLAASYCIAIASHWYIEHNQPLIRVHALFGALANLKMCWLALTRRLHDEYARLGIAEGNTLVRDPLRGAQQHITNSK